MFEGARVLVVEDDSSVRDAVEIAFRGEGFEVRGEPDGTGIDSIVGSFRPDVAVLDVRLPEGPDGCSLVRRLRETEKLPVLLLTAADSLDDRLSGFRAGADDYVSKPFSMAELLARVQALLRRSGWVAPATYRLGDLVIDDIGRTVVRGDNRIELTRIEHNLLVAIVRNAGKVLSKKHLLRQVWGFDAYDENLVEVHVSSLRRRLEVHGPRLIHTERGLGYVARA